MIEYVQRGEIIREAELPADATLLEYLRLECRNTSAKEGCASGDCGACTVALGQLTGDGVRFTSVNGCILPAAELHGRELVTAADLGNLEYLHPVQRAFVTEHASQCGFCTPGFVMSAFVLLQNNPEPTDDEIRQAIAGNLCRCTGYGPIVAAVKQAALLAKNLRKEQIEQEQFEKEKHHSSANLLAQIAPAGTSSGLALPVSLNSLAAALSESPGVQIIAGGTDLMLEVTQNLHAKSQMIGLSRIPELSFINEKKGKLSLGAGVTFSQLLEWARGRLEPLAELLLHIGSDQIRNRGTLGGNLASASPIGDLAPFFIALNGQVKLWSQSGERSLPLEAFFTGYRQTVLEPHEIIHSVTFDLPAEGDTLTVDKVSKRKEDDISTLCQVVWAKLDEGRIKQLQLGLGGMAATPIAARTLAEELIGLEVQSLNYTQIHPLVERHIKPMSDLRGSAAYRIHCSAALLVQSLTSTGGSHGV